MSVYIKKMNKKKINLKKNNVLLKKFIKGFAFYKNTLEQGNVLTNMPMGGLKFYKCSFLHTSVVLCRRTRTSFARAVKQLNQIEYRQK